MDAFRKFNFESDERWKAYLKTVELPSGESEGLMLKLKARWYKKTIDPDFDTTAVVPPPKAAQGSGTATGTTPDGSSSSRTYNSSSNNNGTSSGSGSQYVRPPPPPPPPRYGQYGNAGSGTYGSSSAQKRLFLMHVGMLLLGVLAVVPFLPYSRNAYVFFMRLTIVTFGYKIYLQHGLPSFRPMSMAMAWLQRVMPTADFLHLLVALCFSAQPPMLLVVAPALVLAAYHAAAYAAAHFAGQPLWASYGSRLHALMLRRQHDALLLNAFCEIATGLLLLLRLLTPARSPMVLLMFVQILKLKLHMPDTAAHHRQVWRIIDEKTLSYRRAVPAIERLIQWAANWFMSIPGPR